MTGREEVEGRTAELLSPAVPESLAEVLRGLPAKARFAGPEAWLAALAAAGGDEKIDNPRGESAR